MRYELRPRSASGQAALLASFLIGCTAADRDYGSRAISDGTDPGGSDGSGGSANASGATGGARSDSGTGGNAGSRVDLSPAMPTGAISVEGAALWRNNAAAAYSIIHDDLCGDWGTYGIETHADREATQRGLRIAAGAVAGECLRRNMWADVQRMADNGHEIVSHSWSHKRIPEHPLETEVDQARQSLEANLADHETSFFIFPFDYWDWASVEHLRRQGYIGARAGVRGRINGAWFSDPFAINFDIYGPAWSGYQDDILRAYVEDAIAQGGWAVREFHGVEDGSWETVPLTDYTNHLDYVRTQVNAGHLWLGTPSEVIRYRFAREHCPLPVVHDNVLSFGTLNAQCEKYTTSLSFIVVLEVERAAVRVEQAGRFVETRNLSDRRFSVNLDPSLGSAVLTGHELSE